jgi:dihydrolipoamide dehydrogenase
VIDIKVPDIGDFSDVPVIEVLVAVGEEVAAEQPLITLESDKATMEIPAPAAGVVGELLVALGDKVSEGTPILRLEPAAGDGAPPPEPAARDGAPEAEPAADGGRRAPLVVIGGGPGGYTAAFRAADLGVETILVERYERLGGVCLNVGCIPSKALLHMARVIADAEESEAHGVRFAAPEIDLDALRTWKGSVVDRLTGGIDGLAKQRKVDVVRGTATFTGPHTIDVDGEEIAFEHCIIAAGSSAARLPFLPDDRRIMDSTDALDLEDVPARLLVIGGGIIGLEMATVYDALGAGVTVVEMLDQIIPGADPDIVRPLHRRIQERYDAVNLGVTVTAVEASTDGLRVTFEGGPEPATFDRILVAVGRRPNGAALKAEAAGVAVDERGFIAVDEQMRTNVGHVFAIGDVVGEPMLAHKAMHEGKVAAEVIAGDNVAFDVQTIPSVAYTDPEVAWMGLTESEAGTRGIEVQTAKFPWAASGRALTLGRSEGVTKLIVDPGSRRVLGAGIVGVNAGELVAELVHALEMGADAEDLALTVHPHPTLSETVGLAAEAATGTITDLYLPKRARERSTAPSLSS